MSNIFGKIHFMTADQVYIPVNGTRVRIIDAIAQTLQSNDKALEDLFTLMATFFTEVESNALLNLSVAEDFEAFESITNLAGIVPYIQRGSTSYSLREINPSLSEKIFVLMLRVLRKHSSYLHKGTAFHNLGASQFSSQNIGSALININEALRTDYYATGGDFQMVKHRPAFQVLTDDLKKVNGPEIDGLVSSYNLYFTKSYATDQFLQKINSVTRRGFLLKLFLYDLINQYSLVMKFQQESFPTATFRIPQNEYLLIKRYDCIRDCTMFFEELLRNVMGSPRQSSQTLKPLLTSYLLGRSFGSLDRVVTFYWKQRRGLQKDTSLASFRTNGYKTKQINNKLARIFRGNRSTLGNTSTGKLAKCLLTVGLMRNYTNHHLDLNFNGVKNTGTFEEVFKYCFYAIMFVVMEDSI